MGEKDPDKNLDLKSDINKAIKASEMLLRSIVHERPEPTDRAPSSRPSDAPSSGDVPKSPADSPKASVDIPKASGDTDEKG